MALAGVALGATASAASATPTTADRLAGADRFGTAASLRSVIDTYPNWSGQGGTDEDSVYDVAYLVTGYNYPDGLAAGALAAKFGGSVYLTERDRVPAETAKWLSYARRVVVVGGNESVGPNVWTWLRQNTKAELVSVAGIDRYDTARKLAATPFSRSGDFAAPFATGGTVVLATGENYPDALSGGALAAKVGGPLLLTASGQLPVSTAEELSALAPSKVIVVGGENSISRGVRSSVAALVPKAAIEEISGVDRYDTADKIARAYFTPSWDAKGTVVQAEAPVAYIATGTNYPDAIAASAAAGRLGAPLLLSAPLCMSQGTNQTIEALGVDNLRLVGGQSSLAESVRLRTSCDPAGALPRRTFVQTMAAETGSAKAVQTNPTIGGIVYPRTLSFDTDPRGAGVDYQTYLLGGSSSRFTAVAGIADDNAATITAGHAIDATLTAKASHIEVWGDDRLLVQGEVRQGAPLPIAVDVRGIQRLKLVTRDESPAGWVPERSTASYVSFGDAAIS
jgi:putative cell wall-binding protein